MPKIAREISALEIGRMRAPGFHPVGGVPGLALQISASGARSWVLRITVGSKRRDMGLGAFPGVTLAQAREKARQARESVDQGQDPVLERQRAQSTLRAAQASVITFQSASLSYIEAKSGEWSHPKHRAQWLATLTTYAFPIMGSMHIADVSQVHVLQVLQPIWATKTETATRLRGRIENVIDWATARGYRTGENPARWRGHLDKLLAKPDKIATVVHHKAIPVDDAHAFYTALHAREGMAARALELVLLTAARSGEVRGATWAEFDLVKALWTVPAVRMKAKKEHRVPLSDAALALLKSLPRIEGAEFVFSAPRGGMLSDMSMTAVMRRMELDCVPHGLRSTFRDWTAEKTTFARDLAEKALAHTLESKVEAAYQRSDMLERRRDMMDAWTAFLTLPAVAGDNVVQLGKKAA
jgi:integrase